MKFYFLGEGRVGEGYGNCAKFSNKTKKNKLLFRLFRKKNRENVIKTTFFSFL